MTQAPPDTTTTEDSSAPPKATDAANQRNQQFQNLWNRLRPLFYTENAYDGQYYLDSSKVTAYAVGGFLLLAGGVSWALLSVPRPPATVPVRTPTTKGATPPQPVQVKPPAPVPVPTPRTVPQPITPPIRPAAAKPIAHLTLDPRQKRQAEALAMVQLRSNNRRPYTGVGGGEATSFSGSSTPPLPSSLVAPQFPAQLTVGRSPLPTAQARSTYPGFFPGSTTTSNYPTSPEFPNATQPGNPQLTQNPTPQPPTRSFNTRATALQAGWSLVPPGNWLQVRSLSLVQLLKGKSRDTTFLATVKGTVAVDGQPVIPDGALITGTVERLDDQLGRVYLQFQSLTWGGQTYPLREATAWMLTPEGELSEGVVAQLDGVPNYLGNDAASALGEGAAQVADTLGQTTTTGVSSLGSPYTLSSQSGDLNTALQRASAKGLSSVFKRQTQRADTSNRQLESRGPIYTIPTGSTFVVYLTGGI